MKKLILAASFAILGAVSMNAQDKSEGFKGKWFVMGQAGYGTSNDGDVQDYSVLPAVGHFISPTVAVGAAVGYVGTTVKDVSSTGAFVAQPLVRKYWGITDKLFIFGQASVPMQFGQSKDKVTDTKYGEYSAYGIEIAPGLDYFLAPNWTIETSFGVASWTSVKPKGGDATNDFNFGVNSGLLGGVRFGVKYVF